MTRTETEDELAALIFGNDNDGAWDRTMRLAIILVDLRERIYAQERRIRELEARRPDGFGPQGG
jgi:hypothetical protein